MKKTKTRLCWLLPGLTVLGLDRIVKWVHVHRFGQEDYTKNTGMAFGMFQGNSFLILLLSLALVAGCLFLLRGSKPKGLAAVAQSMIAGGALGNMIDRLTLGYVIDSFPFFDWFVFNVADVGVVAGAALCAFSLLFRPRDWSKA